MESIQNRKVKAWGISIGIHLVLLLLFLLVKYTVPAQSETKEEFLEIALGTDQEGMGNDPAEWMDGPAPEEPSSAATTAESQSEAYHYKDDNPLHDRVAVKKTEDLKTRDRNKLNTPSPDKNRNPQNKPENNTPATPVRNPKHVYKGGQGQGGNSASRDNPGTGSGSGQVPGQAGSPGGEVGGTTFSTNPNLRGRSLRTRPDPNAAFREGGRVVVKVTVNREGNIIRYSITSAANATLRRIVEQKIKSVTFTKSATAPPEQTGTITFNFSTKKQ